MNTTLPIEIIIVIAVTALISIYGFSNESFRQKFLFNVDRIKNGKEYIRLFSSGFLHADWMHLIFNMMTLYFFAPVVLESFGTLGFFLIYFGSIILGNMFSLYLYQNQPWYSALGASGGVSGILFASIAIFPMLELYFYFIPIPIKGYIFGLLYFGYSVYMMLNPRQHDNIGHAAHLGGAFFGLMYAIGNKTEAAMSNALYLGIMALPLIYMGYMVFVKKRIG